MHSFLPLHQNNLFLTIQSPCAAGTPSLFYSVVKLTSVCEVPAIQMCQHFVHGNNKDCVVYKQTHNERKPLRPVTKILAVHSANSQSERVAHEQLNSAGIRLKEKRGNVHSSELCESRGGHPGFPGP